MTKDSLGDRIKEYEDRHNFRHIPLCPIVARMDGRGFHKFTKNLQRPFDAGLSDLMIATAKKVFAESNAVLGYTQSDEITLVFNQKDYQTDFFFDGKHEKLISILASMTTAYFNYFMPMYLPGRLQVQQFDARVFTVPDLTEAANVIVWREQDATRNSVQMAARATFSHRECHGKNRAALMDMLHEKGINWNDYPDRFKRGSFIKRTEDGVDVVPMAPYNTLGDRVESYFGVAS